MDRSWGAGDRLGASEAERGFFHHGAYEVDRARHTRVLLWRSPRGDNVEVNEQGLILPLHVPVASSESQCVRRVLGAASNSRWAGMGHLSLHYSPGSSTTAQPAPSPAPAAPVAPAEPAEPLSLRAQLDARSGAILGCAGGTMATLTIEWAADGAINGSLRGREGSPEDSCVRAILSRERVSPPPGSAGSLLHVVEAR